MAIHHWQNVFGSCWPCMDSWDFSGWLSDFLHLCFLFCCSFLLGIYFFLMIRVSIFPFFPFLLSFLFFVFLVSYLFIFLNFLSLFDRVMHFSPRTWTSFPNPKTNPAPPAPLRRAPPRPVACWSALNLQLRFDDHHGTLKQGIWASSKGRGSRTQKNKNHVNPPFGSGLGLSCCFFPGKK